MLSTAADLMHRGNELPLVAEQTVMSDALLVMTEKRFGCVGVVDGEGRLCGAITDGDLRRHIDGLLGHSAAEVMTKNPRVVTPNTLAGEALAQMQGRITVLFVVENERPVGILHIHDLLRAGVI